MAGTPASVGGGVMLLTLSRTTSAYNKPRREQAEENADRRKYEELKKRFEGEGKTFSERNGG